MKKLLLFILTFILTFGIIGCGTGGSSSTMSSTSKKKTSSTKLASSSSSSVSSSIQTSSSSSSIISSSLQTSSSSDSSSSSKESSSSMVTSSSSSATIKPSSSSSSSKPSSSITSSSSSSSSKEEIVCTGITLSGQKTTYAFAEDFTTDGLVVTANYSNGESRNLISGEYLVDVGSFNSLKPNTYGINVTYLAENKVATYNAVVNVANKLKVLMIGNSFADDTIDWAYEVATSAGIPASNVTVADIYIGGCSLDTHWSNAQNNSASYDFRIDKQGSPTTASGKVTMEYAIKYTDWDFITMQQASGSSGLPSAYSNLDNLIRYVKNLATNPNVKLVWHQTWAYQQNSTHGDFAKYDKNQTTMYNAILSTMQSQVLGKDLVAIIPNGTAVQNARTSFIGDNLTRDGYHLNLQYGRYIASLNLVKVLTGRNIDSISWAPSQVGAKTALMCKESVNNANVNPLGVTKSVYTQIDLTGLYKYEMQYVGNAYWQCADETNYNKLILNASNSVSFIASATRFTKSQIPVGSVIKVKAGYKFRSDSWLNDTGKQSSRDDNISTSYFEVTESWWGNYIYRAFNVSKTDGTALTNSYDEVFSALEIYVPYVVTENNPSYNADKNLIPNIDNYKLVKVNIVKGYYNSLNAAASTIVSENKDLSHKYYATNIFNKSTLPVGSYIILDSGYQYRPECWANLGSANTSRPNNVTTNVVQVTSAWWGSYNYRAFNLAVSGASADITGRSQEILSHFRIYVPK